VVSRMLARGERRYFVRDARFLRENIEPAVLREVEARLSRSLITGGLNRLAQERCGQVGPSVRVFAQNAAVGNPITAFAKSAAPHVRALLDRSSICGVTWGRMLMNVIQALGESPSTARAKGLAEFIPLAGEPMGNEPTKSSSSTLASDLARILRAESYHARSLTMVPAFIPKEFTAPERKVLAKLIARSADYGDIFGRAGRRGRDAGLVYRLDCVITSVGYKPLGFQLGSVLDSAEREWFIGDVGGVLLEKPGLKTGARRRAEKVVARWTGLTADSLLACATRARVTGAEGGPGVVVISAGPERARVVLEAVGRGLVNHLLIDVALEQALADLLGVAGGTPPVGPT
jgi:hypothetical protein